MNRIKEVQDIVTRAGNHQQRPKQTENLCPEYTGQRQMHILTGLSCVALYSEIARPTAGNPCYTVPFTLKILFNSFSVVSSFISRWHSTITFNLVFPLGGYSWNIPGHQ